MYGGTKAAWPADASWIPIPTLNDPHNVGVLNHLDCVGDITNPGFYRYTDSTYAYFRIRVDEGTYNSGAWADTVWLMIDGDGNTTPTMRSPGTLKPHQVMDLNSW